MNNVFVKASKALVLWAQSNHLGQSDILYAIASTGGIECTIATIDVNIRRINQVIGMEKPPKHIIKSLEALINKLKKKRLIEVRTYSLDVCGNEKDGYFINDILGARQHYINSEKELYNIIKTVYLNPYDRFNVVELGESYEKGVCYREIEVIHRETGKPLLHVKIGS